MEKLLGSDVPSTQLAGVPTVRPHESAKLYQALAGVLREGLAASVHDLADGGLGVALAESSLGGRLGAHITLDDLPGAGGTPAQKLFSESPSRFLVSVNPKNLEAFRQAFFHFDAHILARQEPSFVEEQMQNAGIIRNRAKITSTITNAQAYLRLQELHGSFSTFIWSFTNHKPIVNHHTTSSTMPSSSPESDAMSAALRGAGFKFVGTTICYAFMQAAGLVNDHLVTCPRWQEAQGLMP
jgi:DNA-3-methyladenine glycosylase I